jgi:hypothetical protein
MVNELETVPMPEAIAKLPRTANGYPQPFMTMDDDIRVISPLKQIRCAVDNLCGICGQKLGYWKAFVGGPVSITNRFSVDPPFHEECARYALQVCPYIVRPTAKRAKEYNVTVTDDPIQILIKPERFGMAITRSFNFGRVPARETLGFSYTKPVKITWWCDGKEI